MPAASMFEELRRGHHDDGREGIVLAKIAAGDLVKVPAGAGTPGLSRVVGSATASAQSVITTNPDGSGAGVNFSIPIGLGQSGSWTETVYGSVVGVRWRRTNSAGVMPFGVVIDGVAYTLADSRYRSAATIVSNIDQEALWIVADDLDPDLPHVVQVVVPSDPYGAQVKSLLLFGWLLEASRGYREPPRWGLPGTAATLSTSTTALSGSSIYRKILLHNTDSVARKVTFKSSSTVLKEVILSAAGAVGSSGEIDFGGPMPGLSTLTLQADANSVVNWMPILAEARA